MSQKMTLLINKQTAHKPRTPQRSALRLLYLHIISDSFSAGTKTIPGRAMFTHKEDDFCAISVTK